jgi:hypothetical protein
MPHLNHYPTLEQVRSLMGQDEIDRLVEKLSDYQRIQEIAKFEHVPLTPRIVSAWALFAQEIQDQIPDLIIGRDWRLSHRLTHDELEEIALTDERSNRYYHPENYPDYTADDITG